MDKISLIKMLIDLWAEYTEVGADNKNGGADDLNSFINYLRNRYGQNNQ